MTTARRAAVAPLLILAGLLVLACRRHRMSEEDCRLVLDRITEIELAESGFRDPVLASRRKLEMRARLATELAACTGRRVHGDALSCVQRARTAEELSHHCLR
jgi:hypothetical protein